MMPDRNGTAEPGGAAGEAVDYRALYTDYWSREDRWGSHSFHDPEPLAEQILSTCGGGRLLDVGCGMGLLVRTLLRRGVDARGVDVAPAPVAEANRHAPGRFEVGSILELPYEDGAFETVISTDCLEHIAEEDVPLALGELARVARRFCFVRLAITPDRDKCWHLTVRDRAWWEERFFAAGFRRHPLAMRVVPYETLADEGWQITLVLEKAAASGGAERGGQDAPPHRDLRREVGDEAEAAIALATRSLQFIRQGDNVYQADPAAGWLAEVVASASRAGRVMQAADRLGDEGAAVGVEAGPASLGALDDRSVDCVLALDHLKSGGDAGALLKDAARVLTPGGRLLVAVGPEAAGGLAGAEGFALERAFGLWGDPGRSLRPIEIEQWDREPQRVLLALATDPIGAGAEGYVERVYPAEHLGNPDFHVASYARDLDNPWLLRTMISMGLRSPNRELVAGLAQRTLESSRRGSADEGAAICVLAYRLLEGEGAGLEEVDRLIGQIADYHNSADDTPMAWRWRISNQYVAARLHLLAGRLEEARRAFLECAEMDVLPFSPLLASKTIDACFCAGLIAANARDLEAARDAWRRGLEETERVLHADWLNVWGSADNPLAFGLPDVSILVELASRCAQGLVWLDDWENRPGLAWAQTHHQTLADHRRRIAQLESGRDWIERERDRFKRLSQEREGRLEHAHRHVQQLLEARDWLIRQRDEAREALDRAREQIAAAAPERQRLQEELRRRAERIESLADWNHKLTEARSWQEERVSELESRMREQQERLTQQRQRIEELDKAVRWQQENRKRATSWLQEQVRTRDEEIQRLRAWTEQQRQAMEWHIEQREALLGRPGPDEQEGPAPGEQEAVRPNKVLPPPPARSPGAGEPGTMGPGEGPSPPAEHGGASDPSQSPPAASGPHRADRDASRT